MKIILVTPAPPGSLKGNRQTAVRWYRLLKRLGHQVRIEQDYSGKPCDLLIALHARRGFPSMKRYRHQEPDGWLILALTGTDLYRDIHTDSQAQQALAWADRLIVLHPAGARDVPSRWRSKVQPIPQSVPPLRSMPRRYQRSFTACVVGHLRAEKDPFRAAEASRNMPSDSRLRVLHVGQALSEEMERQARDCMVSHPRYHWKGGWPHWKTRALIARSHVLVLSSVMEGGAHVISEAAVVDTPVLASRIPSSVGLLGEGYPGFFEVGATEELRCLFLRCEREPAFWETLRHHLQQRAFLFDPDQERQTWQTLLTSLSRPVVRSR